uniref:Hydroxysteroid dehydrogenase-like protein 2 n=2 Tax=Caenorhabditis japonica TaxID=281687 RepID=A0A8R1HR79_CAEJA
MKTRFYLEQIKITPCGIRDKSTQIFRSNCSSKMFNTGKFVGKTVLITGASRGIGKEIGLKLAQDGANIVIAAKTATANAKLPGTIYTAAEEIEKAGGKALPCIVDVRDESSVKSAVEDAVKKFGGIDILINNASAISLTGTEDTTMKRYDLMHSINTRGTYLMTKSCLPYLKQGKNPHVLNISPPLLMETRWFSNHVAYTMAKFGMSMCVLGHHEEFRPHGIAVNALWPVTTIWTAAMEMLSDKGGEAGCRKPAIMADAAYAVLSKNSKDFTGQFLIDEDVLRAEGVTDFDRYACVPGATLMPDFFIPAGTYDAKFASGQTRKVHEKAVIDEEIKQVFTSVKSLLNAEVVKKIGYVFEFELTDAKGQTSRSITLDLKNGEGSLVDKKTTDSPDVKFTLAAEDFSPLFTGKLRPSTALMTKKLKIAGDLPGAMKLEGLLRKLSQKK